MINYTLSFTTSDMRELIEFVTFCVQRSTHEEDFDYQCYYNVSSLRKKLQQRVLRHSYKIPASTRRYSVQVTPNEVDGLLKLHKLNEAFVNLMPLWSVIFQQIVIDLDKQHDRIKRMIFHPISPN